MAYLGYCLVSGWSYIYFCIVNAARNYIKTLIHKLFYYSWHIIIKYSSFINWKYIIVRLFKHWSEIRKIIIWDLVLRHDSQNWPLSNPHWPEVSADSVVHHSLKWKFGIIPIHVQNIFPTKCVNARRRHRAQSLSHYKNILLAEK